MNKLIKISELSKILDLIEPKTNKPQNYIIRYWEKEFKEIRPKKINNQRYYSPQQVELIKKIKFLLKNKGLTISGVKEFLKFNTNKLDENKLDSLNADYYKINLKVKSKLILNKINKIKNYGKKNSS
jgi:DNA-binding transcriptional MerR regulator